MRKQAPEIPLPPTLMGFPSHPGWNTKKELLVSEAFARGDHTLAQTTIAQGNVRVSMQLEYFFTIGALDVCRAIWTPTELGSEEGAIDPTIHRPRSFVMSNKPLQALEFFEFLHRIKDESQPASLRRRNGLLQNLDQREDFPALNKAYVTTSPTGGLVVVVYAGSHVDDLCVAFYMGVEVTREHIEFFSGLVPAGLLAKALFRVREIDLLAQVVSRFPEACAAHINALNPRQYQRVHVEAIQACLQSMLLREAARAVLLEASA